MRKSTKKVESMYLRNVLFGAEDSLVSTVGFLFGLASNSDYTSKLVAVAGVVLITVEALSMGVGAFLSESEVEEVEKIAQTDESPMLAGILMFFAYMSFGILVLLPYFLASLVSAKYISMGFTLIALFLVGYIPTRNYKSGVRMLIIAGFTIIVGFLVAKIL